MSKDDQIAPPKKPLTFVRALRGSFRRNPWQILSLLAFVGVIVLRGFLGGDVRSMLVNGLAVGFIVFVISMTLAPAIRKQNEEERRKRESETKP
jgi:hypothetical protein